MKPQVLKLADIEKLILFTAVFVFFIFLFSTSEALAESCVASPGYSLNSCTISSITYEDQGGSGLAVCEYKVGGGATWYSAGNCDGYSSKTFYDLLLLPAVTSKGTYTVYWRAEDKAGNINTGTVMTLNMCVDCLIGGASGTCYDNNACNGKCQMCDTSQSKIAWSNVASGYVCISGSGKVAVSSTNYCNYGENCDDGECSAQKWWTSCDGSGSCRAAGSSPPAGSFTQTVYPNSGYTLTSDCTQTGTTRCNATVTYNKCGGIGNPYSCQKGGDIFRCDVSHNCAFDVGDDWQNVGAGKVCSGGSEISASSLYYCGFSSYNARSADKCDKKKDYLACNGSNVCNYSDYGDAYDPVSAYKIANSSGSEVDASSGDYAGSTCHSCIEGACSGTLKWAECDGSGNAGPCSTYNQSETVYATGGYTLTSSCGTVGTANCGYSAYNKCGGAGSPYSCQKGRDILRCDASHNCAYDAGDDWANVAAGKVCEGGAEVALSTTRYCGYLNSNLNNCQWRRTFSSCNGSNVCSGVTVYSDTTCNTNQATKGQTSCSAVTTSNYCGYACDGLCRIGYYGCIGSGFSCETTFRAWSNCSAATSCSGTSCSSSNLCDATWRISTPGDNGYGAGGSYSCQGKCDGSNNCDYAANCNALPICDSLSAAPSFGDKPLTVIFLGSGHDPDGTISNYQWDFDGDGNWDQTTAVNSAGYVYSNTGAYCAKLRIQDNQSAWSTAPGSCPAVCTVQITVSEDTVVPSITINTPSNQWYNSNPFLDVDFSDDKALDDGFYQIDSFAGAWTAIFTDNAGTSYTTDFKISDSSWTGFADGSSHTIYFKTTDDSGNQKGADGSKYLVIKKDISGPVCAIQLRQQGTTNPITEVNTGQAFDIYVGGSSDGGIGISQTRFSSDDSQNGTPEGAWTSWYEWGSSSGDWNSTTKVRSWSFASAGSKEVWTTVKDGLGQSNQCRANIYVNSPPVSTIYRFSGTYLDDPGNSWQKVNFTRYIYDYDSDGSLSSCEYYTYDNKTSQFTASGTRTPCVNGGFNSREVKLQTGNNCPSQGKNACTLGVRCKDNDGSYSGYDTATYHIDWTLPVVGTISPVLVQVGSPQTFSAAVSDNVELNYCWLFVDGQSEDLMNINPSPCQGGTGCTALKEYTFDSAGTYSLYATCSDQYDTQSGTYLNTASGTPVSVTAATLGVTLDAIPPSGTIYTDFDLQDTVSGTMPGTANFMFDCRNDGSWEAKYDGINLSVSDSDWVQRVDYYGHTFHTKITSPNIFAVKDLCAYSSNGTYTAKTSIERGVGTAIDTTSIPVSANAAPTAGICCQSCASQNCTTYTGDVFTLINNSSDPNGSGDILKSEWDILGYGSDPDFDCCPSGCDSVNSLCDYTIQTQVLGNGDYTAELYVEDLSHASNTVTKPFTIKQDALADFKCSLDNLSWQDCEDIQPGVAETVYFQDQSTASEGATITHRSWIFSDGDPATDIDNNPNPSTQFQSAGSKQISLTITDSALRTASNSHNIISQLPLPEWEETAPF